MSDDEAERFGNMSKAFAITNGSAPGGKGESLSSTGRPIEFPAHAAEGAVETLSKRERAVFDLVGIGYSSKDIANVLFISKRTVDFHRSNILKKLKIRTAQELICVAARFRD